MLVEPVIKMGGKKIYTAGTVMLNQVEMLGGDTIFATNELSIYSITAAGQNNVIKLSIGMPYVLVGSKAYRPGEIINGNIKVEQCPNDVLPIREESLQVIPTGNGVYKVSFTTTTDDSDGFILWVKVNGVNKKILVTSPVLGKRHYSFNVTKDQLLK